MDQNRNEKVTGEDFFLDYFNSDRVFNTLKRADYLLLRAIQSRAGERGRPGRTYLSDLAAALDIPIPTLSKTVERLQDKGLVAWKTDNAAGQTYVKLTSKAVELMDDESRRMKTAYERIRAEIDERDLKQSLETARKVAEILNATRREGV